MADRTGIEWTDATWNPIVGCSIVSPGCTNCYAMKMAARIEAMQPGSHYAGTTQASKAGAVWTGKLALAPESILTQPLRWRRTRKIFVNSMGDLFHEDVPDAWIDRVFAVMALTPQHTYQVLTKRSARMLAYMNRACGRIADAAIELRRTPLAVAQGIGPSAVVPLPHVTPGGPWWPLPNVWLGVSTEDQRRADERVPDLLSTPATIRFVSAEPLLGPLTLRSLNERTGERGTITDWHDALAGLRFGPSQHETAKLDLVIVGGESGTNARPMHPDWARSLRDQCAAAGTAFFFKQWGEWLDERIATASGMAPGPDMFNRFGAPKGPRWCPYDAADRNGGAMIRVGKHAAGRLLDGVEHNALPEARP